MAKVRCKVCGATAVIEAGKNSFNIEYPRGKSWYGKDFGHTSLKECPLTRGMKAEEILKDKDIEVVG